VYKLLKFYLRLSLML